MNEFEKALAVMIGQDNLELIQNIKIGVAGCGGLGSNVAFNLVRSGFKRFVIDDFDRIEYSNLNRQFFFYDQVGRFKSTTLRENLLRINPDLEVEAYTEVLDPSSIEQIYSACDIVVEAFDSASMKKTLIDSLSNRDVLLVSASGLAGWGDSDKIVTKKFGSNLYVVGDFSSEASSDSPPISPRVNIAAAKQANIVLSHILNSLEVKS